MCSAITVSGDTLHKKEEEEEKLKMFFFSCSIKLLFSNVMEEKISHFLFEFEVSLL